MRVSWLTEPDEDSDERQRPPRDRLKLAVTMLAGWLAVSLIVLVGLLTFAGPRSTDPTAPASPSGPAAAGSTSPGSSSALAGPSGSPAGSQRPAAGLLLRAGDDQTDCAAYSYGQVQVFFARTPCASVRRSLFSARQDGRDVVVAVSTVTFDNPSQAADYLDLVTSDGTGNVNDLLREGGRYPGSPSKLPAAAFASRRDGVRVVVAEAAFAQGRSDNQDAGLLAIARRAVDAG